MEKQHIVIEDNVLQNELKEYCREKEIILLTTNGSPIDILTLFTVHKPFVTIVNKRDTVFEICQSLIKANMMPRFILIAEEAEVARPALPCISFARRGDTRGIISLIRERLIEKISKELSFNEEFESYADNYIYETLAQLGFRLKNSGTRYLHDVLGLMLRNEYDTVSSVTKEIYPFLAKRYNTTPVAIERNIRTAIGHYWDNRRSIHHLGNMILPLAENDITPGNKETIQYISAKILTELKKKKAEMKREQLKNL